MFLDLYRSLGEDSFRRGFARLYTQLLDLALVEEIATREDCLPDKRTLCHMMAAFVEGVPEADAAIAEEVIIRRYYGASP